MKKIFFNALLIFLPFICQSQHQGYYMEALDRGLVAIKVSENSVFLSWRLLANDPSGITFDMYRNGEKINTSSIDGGTNYTDQYIPGATYNVIGKAAGFKDLTSDPVGVWENEYLRIPLVRPVGGTDYSYEPNDASVADLDNDGEYEVVLKWQPTNAKDNSQSGYTANVYLDAYQFDGRPLWRINLGKNIRAGAHYTQFLVYDFESDGYPELVCKTADGTVDGTGNIIGDPDADYRNSGGYILEGPEYLTVFDGLTGEEKATTNYLPARGNVSAWGDSYGNRVDRFLAGVGYFDGEQPSILMTRGYYTRSVLVAWDYRNGELKHRWTFDTSLGYPEYSGKGNHSLSIADLDSDGKDEVIFGAIAIDDDGTPLHKATWGHGDALHVSDFDPDRPGMEIMMPVEWASGNPDNNRPGLTFRDGKTGELIWGAYPTGEDVDVGRGVSGDITSAFPGAESWGAKGLGLYNSKGEYVGNMPASMNFLIWWDGDLTRELLSGNTITKYGEGILLQASGAISNNGSKATPALTADLFGDWREEMILREENNQYLRIYSTTIPTDKRMMTLMHDRQYREAIAWQNVGYNQPPHTSFFFGHNMAMPEKPNIIFAGQLGENQEVLDIDKSNKIFSDLIIYPNPSPEGKINIKFGFDKLGKDLQYQLFDLNGRQLAQGETNGSITLHSLSKGLYLLKLVQKEVVIAERKIQVN